VGNNRVYTETYTTYDEAGNKVVSTYTYTDETKQEMTNIERDTYEVIRTHVSDILSDPYGAMQYNVDGTAAAVGANLDAAMNAYVSAIGDSISEAFSSAFGSLFE
jgi:S-methylmethionine-dependent homocysteine/selenocysteine methylase